MNVTFVIGMNQTMKKRAGGVLAAIRDTLVELGVSILDVDLMACGIPYFESGYSNDSFAKVAKGLEGAANVVFFYNVTDSTPSAVMKVFLEYFNEDANMRLLANKNLFNVAISEDSGERAGAGIVADIIGKCGGYEVLRLLIGGNTLSNIISGSFPIVAIEKYAEDFYRLINQNRTFVPSSLSAVESDIQKNIADIRGKIAPKSRANIVDEYVGGDDVFEMPMKDNVKAINTKRNDYEPNPPVDNDIEELTKLFSQKLKPSVPPKKVFDGDARTEKPYGIDFLTVDTPNTTSNLFGSFSQKPQNTYSPAVGTRDITPRNKTLKQLTQNLPHYFQSQVAGDTEAVFQFNIAGSEQFFGYIVVKDRDAEYYDGQMETPDITIIADTEAWGDILKGKYSAQKAFMTGQLKVRGNFMLLNRFDLMFKL